LILKI